MVQKEIKKKVPIYGIVGILSAIVLVALIYSFGTAPLVSPPNASPSTSPSPAPTETLNVSPWPSPSTSPLPAPTPEPNPPEISPMPTFASYADLVNFLTNKGNSDTGTTIKVMPTPSAVPAPAPMGVNGEITSYWVRTGTGSTATSDYSRTNIQVAGVDEADTVKTDGNYLYVIANNNVYILNANPQNAQVLAKIPFTNADVSGIYLSQDGSKLAVLGNQYVYYSSDKMPTYTTDLIMPPYWNSGRSFVYVYDVANRNSPVLARNFTMSGNYFDSRMIGNYVYDIITEYVYVYNDAVPLPIVYAENSASQIAPDKIYYTNITDSSYTYTTFIALNIMDNTQQPTNMTIMTGGASDMYVSLNNIYVTFPQWNQEGTSTSIYRVHIADNALTFYAKGNVSGSVLNQYSMDEYNGYFRVATTTWNNMFSIRSDTQTEQQNNVYVLNMSLAVVGKLENLAPGENLYAARFMGNRCYLVTYVTTDPLFAIDLSQPNNPRVLGELKIPGYSNYLHPYDETHLIGIGKDAVTAAEGDFAWYQGLKLALFDVSDVSQPKEIANYIIGDRGTDSAALNNPKAFLFDRARDLLVIPVNLAEINRAEVSPGPSAYGKMVWQGAYVFKVTLNGGFELKGKVTQIDNSMIPTDPFAIISGDLYTIIYNHFINRSLYIGNTLYTISNARVQLNSLDNFALQAKIDLN